MHSANRSPVPQTRRLKKAAAAAVMLGVTLAGCTTESKGGAESPTPSAAAVPQVAGLTALNLVFVANPNGHDQVFAWSFDSPGESPVQVTDTSCNSNNPEPSPDGERLVYYADCGNGMNQIYTYNFGSHTQVQLTGDTHVQNYDPTYVLGPSGEYKIDWKRSDAAGNYGELWEMDADGSNRHNLTAGLIAAKREAWKPNSVSSTQRVFTIRERQGDPNSDELYSLNVASGTTRRLTNNTVPDWFPSYNQKQNKVLFITKQDGHDVLATMNPDGTDRTVVVDMPGDSDDPSWSPDGSTVVFINNGSGKYSIYAKIIATGQQVLLYDGNKYGRALAPVLAPMVAG